VVLVVVLVVLVLVLLVKRRVIETTKQPSAFVVYENPAIITDSFGRINQPYFYLLRQELQMLLFLCIRKRFIGAL
jgi:hypothetical protein